MTLFHTFRDEASREGKPVLILVTSSSCHHCVRLKEEGGVSALSSLCEEGGCNFHSVDDSEMESSSFNTFVDGIRLPGFPTLVHFPKGTDEDVTFHHPSSFRLASVGVREGCPFCAKAKTLLSEEGIPSSYHNVRRTEGEGTVPQVAFHQMGRKDGRYAPITIWVGGSDRLESMLKKERRERGSVPRVERCQGNFCREGTRTERKRRAEEKEERRRTRQRKREERSMKNYKSTKRTRRRERKQDGNGTGRRGGNRGVW